jgi:ribonuclease BN (tRNA processing enzyme)
LGRTSILLDCGEPISRSYAASGLSYNLVDHILLSHLHADHVGGFPMLMQGFWLRRRTKALMVHMPREGIAPLRRGLRSGFLFDGLFRFKLDFKALSAGRSFKLGGVSVTPCPTSHLDGLRARFKAVHRQPFAVFSFLFETSRLRVAHSCDIGKPDDLEPLLHKPLNLLACELAHFEPADLLSYLRGRPIERLVLTHLPDRLWRSRHRLQKQAAKALPGTLVTVAEDMQQVRL